MNAGALDQMIRTLKEIKSQIGDETSFKKILKQRIQIEGKNQLKYLMELRDSQDYFNDVVLTSINSLLMSLNSPDVQQEYFTPKQLQEIFKVSKGTISSWIDKKYITSFKQEKVGGKIEIPRSQIDSLVEYLPKYENLWINYNEK